MVGWTSTNIDITGLQSVGIAAECDSGRGPKEGRVPGETRTSATVGLTDVRPGAPRMQPRRKGLS